MTLDQVNALKNPLTEYETVSFYTSYVAEFGKEYQTVNEFQYRMELFHKTEEFIRSHNAKQETMSFYLGHN